MYGTTYRGLGRVLKSPLNLRSAEILSDPHGNLPKYLFSGLNSYLFPEFIARSYLSATS